MTDDISNHPSTPRLIGDAIRQTTELISTELALVRLEAGEKLTIALASIVSLVVAAIFIIVALIFLLEGLVEFLVTLGLPDWGASLAVGGGIAFIALIAVLIAVRNLRLSRLKPTRTLRQVETARSAVGGKSS